MKKLYLCSRNNNGSVLDRAVSALGAAELAYRVRDYRKRYENVNKQLKELGEPTLKIPDYDGILEEVVSDYYGDVMLNKNVAERFLEGAPKGVVSKFANYIDDLKDAIAGDKVNASAKEYVRQLEEVSKLPVMFFAQEAHEKPEDFSIIKDPGRLKEINKVLDDEDGEGKTWVKAYHSMSLIDGKLYAPMNSMERGEDGKLRLGESAQVGDVIQADEHPERARWNGKSWVFDLTKSNGKSVNDVAYDPYMHSSPSMLNDQFKEANNRADLVTVEVRIPISELDGSYWAGKTKGENGEWQTEEGVPYSLLPTGTHDWHKGAVASKLTGTKDDRKVHLSRYFKVTGIVDNAEVGKEYARISKEYDIAFPINTMTQEVAKAFAKAGGKVGNPEKGMKVSPEMEALVNAKTETAAEYRKRMKSAEPEEKFSLSRSKEEFDDIRERSKVEYGIVSPNLVDREIRVVGIPMHTFKGKFQEEVLPAAIDWAEKNLPMSKPRTINKGTQDEMTYIISNNSIDEFFHGSAWRSSKKSEKAGYISVMQNIHDVIDGCVETEVHPDYIEKDANGKRKRDGKIDDHILIHEYRGVVNVDGQPFNVRFIFKETDDFSGNNPAYAYELQTIKIKPSDSTSQANRNSEHNETMYAPDNFIPATKVFENIDKSYDPGVKLLDASAKGTNLQSQKLQNGESLSLKQTKTDNFKKWFGDWEKDPENASKVVNEDGTPKIVYHGTITGGFSRFNRKTGGIYFADQVAATSDYADTKKIPHDAVMRDLDTSDIKSIEDVHSWLSNVADYINKAGAELDNVDNATPKDVRFEISGNKILMHASNRKTPIEFNNGLPQVAKYVEQQMVQRSKYPVYLDMKKPLVIDAQGKDWAELPLEVDGIRLPDATRYQTRVDSASTDEWARYLQTDNGRKLGYDGIIVKNVYDSKTSDGTITDYIVFEPTQIKSATENNGDFSRENSDIRYSLKQPKFKYDNSNQLTLFDEDNEKVFGKTPKELLFTRRKLEDGEECKVERIFRESGAFDFTSGENVESIDDVAHIFKQLENSAVENSFVCFVKDGKPTVLHLGMGGFDYAGVNIPAIKLAYDRMKPDDIYFIHNHPSGSLKASGADVDCAKSIENSCGVTPINLIIDTTSGQFGEFNIYNQTFRRDYAKALDKEIPLELFSFDKQVFSKDYDASKNVIISGSRTVAAYISGHRLGERNKLGALVINKNGGIIGNVFIQEPEITKKNAMSVANKLYDDIVTFGGFNAVVFGTGAKNTDGVNVIKERLRDGEIRLLDCVDIAKDGAGEYKYESFAERGVMDDGGNTPDGGGSKRTLSRAKDESYADFAKRIQDDYEASKGQDKFSLKGVQGAAELDKKDGGNRMANLGIAENMEKANKNALTIKVATGWERGADGKWRHVVNC